MFKFFARFTSFLFILSVANTSISDDRLTKIAHDKAKHFILTEEVALQDYLMLVDSSVQSTAESELLVSSTATMSLLRSNGVELGLVNWRPRVFDDARQGKSKDAVSPMLIAGDFVELRDGTRIFNFRSRYQSLNLVTEFDELPQSLLHMSFRPTVVLPFDWPLVSIQSFSQNGGRGAGRAYLENKLCFLAIEKEDLLETYWTIPNKSMAFLKISFRDDVIEIADIYWVGSVIDPDKLDVVSGVHKLIRRIQTKWRQFEDVLVPESVQAILIEGKTTFEVSAKLRFFDGKSKEFLALEKELNQKRTIIEKEAERGSTK